MGEIEVKTGKQKYTEEVKELLKKYYNEPENREKYISTIFKRNKNKLLIAMLNILEEEINNYSFDESDESPLYLVSLLEVLPKTISDYPLLIQNVTTSLNGIHREINEKLHINEKNRNTRYKLLEYIRIKLDDRILEISNESPVDYDACKEDYISYLIFQVKNINFIEKAIEEYPYIVNIKDKKNVPLINRVLKVYLRAVDKYTKDKDLGPIDDLIYYKRILKMLITSDKISLNDEDKKALTKTLSDHLAKADHDVIRQKEKHTYFVNSIIMMLYGKDEENDLKNLNYEYEVHDTFKATHELEAERIRFINSNIKGKKSKKKIYTFDGEGAFELDDALSIEKEDGIYHLGVHIANPLAYISTNSILYDEARKRTRSLYFGDKCIPMIPFSLSGDTMSLNEGVYRHAMSHYFDIDAQTGELLNYRVVPEVIKVTKNLTYDKFNQDIAHGSDDDDYMETLINLCEISTFLGKVYNEDVVYQEFHNDNSKTIATSVVEKCMIYTNYNLAKLFAERNLPYIYRCHTVDDKLLSRIDQLTKKVPARSDNKFLARNYELIKNIYPRAYYTTKNVGHMGLGTDYYSHVTSPLRRFSDNIAGECIYKFLIHPYTEEDIKRYQEYIDQMADTINAKRRTLDNYEIERGRRIIK